MQAFFYNFFTMQAFFYNLATMQAFSVYCSFHCISEKLNIMTKMLEKIQLHK